jgi:hypothetical protein
MDCLIYKVVIKKNISEGKNMAFFFSHLFLLHKLNIDFVFQHKYTT